MQNYPQLNQDLLELILQKKKKKKKNETKNKVLV